MNIFGVVIIIGLILGSYAYFTASPQSQDDFKDGIKGTVESITKSNSTEDNSTIEMENVDEIVVNGIPYVKKDTITCLEG